MNSQTCRGSVVDQNPSYSLAPTLLKPHPPLSDTKSPTSSPSGPSYSVIPPHSDDQQDCAVYSVITDPCSQEKDFPVSKLNGPPNAPLLATYSLATDPWKGDSLAETCQDNVPPPLPIQGPRPVVRGRRGGGKGGVSRCLGVCAGVMVVMALVVSLGSAGGVTILALHFMSDKSEATITSSSVSQLEGFSSRLQRMEMRNEELVQMVMELQRTIAELQEDDSETTPPPNMTTPTTPTPPPDVPSMVELRNVTLSGVDLFQDCTTSIETQCTVTPGEGAGSNDFRLCITDFITIHRPEEYVLNINCLLVVETLENNPLIATLDISDNWGACRCYVPTLNTANQVAHPVTCGLQITRCTTPTNITARF